MANEHVDVVTVGAGWTAGILAEQLTRAGLKVVSLEQAEVGDTALNFSHDHDELRYQVRRDMMVDLAKRNLVPGVLLRRTPRCPCGNMDRSIRQAMALRLGRTGHAEHWRFYPSDFQYRTHHIERYGEDKLPAGNRIQPLAGDLR